MDDNDKPTLYYIPPNYEDDLITSSGRSTRNLVEACLFFGFFVLVFIFLPLSLKYRVILIMVFGMPSAAFAYIGIKGFSLTEYFGMYLKFRSKNHNLSKFDLFQDKKEDVKIEEAIEIPKENGKRKKKLKRGDKNEN